MSPVIFTIGPFEIRWYSVLILIGVILAYKIIYIVLEIREIRN